MTVSLFQRRRAERFAQLVEEVDGGRRHHTRSADDGNLRTLVGLTGRLSDLPLTVEAHPEFREGLRAMLMATVEREGIGATAAAGPESTDDTSPATAESLLEQRRTKRRVRALGTLVAGLAAGALALSGISLASGNALPGDRLYGFKRSAERAQMALTGSDAGKGQLHLELAKTRLDEARAVRDDHARFTSMLDDMDAESREGVRLLTTTAVDRRDPAALDFIDSFVTAQRQSLGRLRPDLASGSRERVDSSEDLLVRISGRSVALRPLLPCGFSSTGDADELGPTPGARCDESQRNGEGTTDRNKASADPSSPTPTASHGGNRQAGASGSPAAQNRTMSAGSTPTPPVDTQTEAPLENGELLGNPSDVLGGLPN